MKYLVLILFATFGLQNDTTKVDTMMAQSLVIQKRFDEMNTKLDSMIYILEQDTIKKK